MGLGAAVAGGNRSSGPALVSLVTLIGRRPSIRGDDRSGGAATRGRELGGGGAAGAWRGRVLQLGRGLGTLLHAAHFDGICPTDEEKFLRAPMEVGRELYTVKSAENN